MLRRPSALHHCSHLSGCDLPGSCDAALYDTSRGLRSQMLGGVIGLFGPSLLAFLDELDSPPIDNVQIAPGGAENDKRRPSRVRFQAQNGFHGEDLAAKFGLGDRALVTECCLSEAPRRDHSPVADNNGRRVSGERRGEADERVRCMRVSGATLKTSEFAPLRSPPRLAYRAKRPYAKAAGNDNRKPGDPDRNLLSSNLRWQLKNSPHRLERSDDAKDAARH
jgi:hypothetical protein